MKKLLLTLISMATIAITAQAEPFVLAVTRELDNGRWFEVTSKMPQADFNIMLKDIGAQERVQFSEASENTLHGEKLRTYLSTPTAQNKNILVVVRIAKSVIHMFEDDRDADIERCFTWVSGLPYNN
jgi:hypothetical protein